MKTPLLFLPLVLGMVFLWNAGGMDCLGNDGSVTVNVSPSPFRATSDNRTTNDSDAPANHTAVIGFSGWTLPAAYLSGENNGGRQLSSSQGRLTILVRLLGSNGNIVRGSYFRNDDIRSYYGLVRPHLYFCRLLI